LNDSSAFRPLNICLACEENAFAKPLQAANEIYSTASFDEQIARRRNDDRIAIEAHHSDRGVSFERALESSSRETQQQSTSRTARIVTLHLACNFDINGCSISEDGSAHAYQSQMGDHGVAFRNILRPDCASKRAPSPQPGPQVCVCQRISLSTAHPAL